MYEQEIRRLREIVEDSKNIVFFGGAGVSTESGIPDFRSEDGLYRQKYSYPPEQIISHTFFVRHPEIFFEFYKDKMMALDAKPNAAHIKLAQWEQEGRLTAVITQNIDGLHQAAGSKNRTGASRKHSPQLLPELRKILRRPVCKRHPRDSALRVRRRDQAGRGPVRRRIGSRRDPAERTRHRKCRHTHHRRHVAGRIPGGRIYRLFPGETSGSDQ